MLGQCIIGLRMKISKQDYHLVPVDADKDFSPENNRRIIEETIKKSKLLQERKRREGMDKVKERTEAMAQYLNSLNNGKTTKVTDYFDRHELARLRGEEILNTIKGKIGDVTKSKIKEQAKIHASNL